MGSGDILKIVLLLYGTDPSRYHQSHYNHPLPVLRCQTSNALQPEDTSCKSVTILFVSCLVLQTTDVLQTLFAHEPGVPEALIHIVPGLMLHSQKPLDAANCCWRYRSPDIFGKHESRIPDLVRDRTVLYREI